MFIYMLEHSSLLAWFWFMLFLAFGMAIYWFIRAKGSFAERVSVVKEKYFARNFEGLSVSVIFLILAGVYLFCFFFTEYTGTANKYHVYKAEKAVMESSNLAVKPLEAEFTALLDAVVYSRDEQNGDKVSEFTPLDEKKSIATVTFGDSEVTKGSATSFMVNRADKLKIRTNEKYQINYEELSKGNLSIYPDSEQNLRSVKYKVTGFNKEYKYYLDGVTRIPEPEVERGETMITIFTTFSRKEKDDEEDTSLPPYRVVKEHSIIGYDSDWNIKDCYLIRQ